MLKLIETPRRTDHDSTRQHKRRPGRGVDGGQLLGVQLPCVVDPEADSATRWAGMGLREALATVNPKEGRSRIWRRV